MKNFLYLILICLIGLNIVLFFKMRSIHTFSSSIRTTKLTNELYYNKFKVEKENEYLNFPKNFKLIDIKGDTVFAKDVFKQHKVVFRYSLTHCDACVHAEHENIIKELQAKPNYSKNICLLAYYENIRGLIVDYRKFKAKKVNISMYAVAKNNLDIPIEAQNLPYYFIIDSNLRMTNFYIPDKEKTNWSKSYLRLALKNYFNK